MLSRLHSFAIGRSISVWLSISDCVRFNLRLHCLSIKMQTSLWIHCNYSVSLISIIITQAYSCIVLSLRKLLICSSQNLSFSVQRKRAGKSDCEKEIITISCWAIFTMTAMLKPYQTHDELLVLAKSTCLAFECFGSGTPFTLTPIKNRKMQSDILCSFHNCF